MRAFAKASVELSPWKTFAESKATSDKSHHATVHVFSSVSLKKSVMGLILLCGIRCAPFLCFVSVGDTGPRQKWDQCQDKLESPPGMTHAEFGYCTWPVLQWILCVAVFFFTSVYLIFLRMWALLFGTFCHCVCSLSFFFLLPVNTPTCTDYYSYLGLYGSPETCSGKPKYSKRSPQQLCMFSSAPQ